MKKFAFSLEPARRWRAAQLTQAEEAYRALVAADRDLCAALQDLRFNLETERRSLHTDGKTTGGQLAQIHAFINFTARESKRIEREREDVANRMKQQWQVLVDARRAAELIERLRAEEFGRWNTELDHEMQILADEAFSVRFAGSGRGRMSRR